MRNTTRRVHLAGSAAMQTYCGKIIMGSMRTRPIEWWHNVVPDWRCRGCSAAHVAWIARPSNAVVALSGGNAQGEFALKLQLS